MENPTPEEKELRELKKNYATLLRCAQDLYYWISEHDGATGDILACRKFERFLEMIKNETGN
jgi:hypothetical protein